MTGGITKAPRYYAQDIISELQADGVWTPQNASISYRDIDTQIDKKIDVVVAAQDRHIINLIKSHMSTFWHLVASKGQTYDLQVNAVNTNNSFFSDGSAEDNESHNRQETRIASKSQSAFMAFANKHAIERDKGEADTPPPADTVLKTNGPAMI